MKKYLVGLFAGVMLTTSITIFAAGGRTIEVFDIVKKVVVNKENKVLGNDNKPFVYNGSTYVPLRFIAEALGEDVSWDRGTGSVYIGEKDIVEVHDWSDFEPLSKSASRYQINSTGLKNTSLYLRDVENIIHDNVIYHDDIFSSDSFEYSLRGKYSRFTGEFGLTKARSINRGCTLNIYLDGDLAYSKLVGPNEINDPIDLDLRGVMKIRFEFRGVQATGHGKGPVPGIFDGKFYK